jgi:hypothetical protein
MSSIGARMWNFIGSDHNSIIWITGGGVAFPNSK